MSVMAGHILSIKEFPTDEMLITPVSCRDVITAQPVQIGCDLWLYVRKGNIHIISDIISSDIGPGSFSVFNAGRILEVLGVSEDFSSDVVILPESFRDELAIGTLLPLKIKFNTAPTIPLGSEMASALEDFISMAGRIISLKDNPYRKESLLNLTRAFYYGGGYYIFQNTGSNETEDSLPSRFLMLVEKNASREHGIGFYADKLCLTSKYLSRLVKKTCGSTAKEIISGYVLLHARTKLLNTDLTVQQISDSLGFPSQSVFGKFFKGLTGLSPKEYREGV